MTQNDLFHAVASATGETVATIRQLGFGIADPDVVSHDPEPYDLDVRIVDWDRLDAQRHTPAFPRLSHRQPIPV